MLFRSEFNYASYGIGSGPHLATELFRFKAGVDIVHVPYTGGGPAAVGVMGNSVQMLFSSILPVLGLVRGGQLKAIALASDKRSPLLPDVPSIAESGFPGFDTAGWFSMYTTPKTPPAIVQKLNAEILAVVNTSEMRERLLTLGATPLPGTPDDLRRKLASEVPAWRKVITDAGLKAD